MVFVFLLAAILLPGATAQERHISFPDSPRFTIQRLEEQFGLDAVTVTAMGQDAQGFLWIGTQTGLYRYDGARARKMTEVESITGHYVTDLLIAPDGTPWFAGNHGIAHFVNGQFEKLVIPSSAMPLAAGNQLFAVDSKGIVYILLFKGGVLRLNPGNPAATRVIGENEGIQESSAGIVRAADDSIWFTFSTHLAHIPAGSNSLEVDPRIRLPKDRIVALLFDGTQTLWLRTAVQLARLDPQAHTISFDKDVVGPANEEEGKPSLDQHGRLLVPTSGGLYWREGSKWEKVTDKQGISSNDIECALEDREGTLWVAGSGNGLDRLPGVHEWEAWTTAEGLPDNSTWSTLRDHSGRLWVSTSRGIGVWDGQTHRWERIPSLDQYSRREIRQMQLAGDGAVWALTGTGGLVRIDANRMVTNSYPNYRGRVFTTIMAAPDGSIWGTTRSHIIRFDPKSASRVPKEIASPSEDGGEVDYLSFSPDGTVWATGPGKLYCFDGKNWKVFTAQNGLQGQTINSVLALSSTEVWIAYNDVVAVTHVKLDPVGAAHMEHHNWDLSILGHDSKNQIWFNGTDGIAILSPDGRLQRKSHADGLVWDDVSPWTGVREEADGSIVIATSRGLARHQPSEFPQPQAAPDVMLTSVTLGGVERRITDAPEVPPSDGSLAIQFTPMILDNSGLVSCRYQLNGLEKQPAETPLREVRYGALPAGSYEFWVQCQGARTQGSICSSILSFPSLAEFLADLVGSGFRGAFRSGSLVGFCFVEDQSGDPAPPGAGAGSGRAERGAATEKQGTGRDFADRSADHDS